MIITKEITFVLQIRHTKEEFLAQHEDNKSNYYTFFLLTKDLFNIKPLKL